MGIKKASESGFTTTLIKHAAARGWLCYHQRPARTAKGWRTALQGHKGFPDLVLVRGGRLIFAELKMPGNEPTPSQREWVWRLEQTKAEVYVWTPASWDQIEEVLR